MKKYSVSLHGHATSISLEPEFWQQICQIAATRGQSVASLISEIDDSDPQRGAGFQMQLRLFVLEYLLQKQPENDPKPHLSGSIKRWLKPSDCCVYSEIVWQCKFR